jgi:imidazolonepropionase-like amidohydrolase
MIALAWWAAQAWAADCTEIVGAKVYFPDGARVETVAIVGDHVVVGDGPGRCEQVDGTGKVLTAGLIESASQLGVTEIDLEDATTDGDGGGDPIRAALQVADAYNPRSTAIPVSRIGGITSAVVEPAGGLVSGQSAFVDLAGATQAETVRSASVAMRVNLGVASSRAMDFLALHELLEEGRVYGRSPSRWRRSGGAVEGASALDLEALQPVLSGDLPMVVAVDRAADIERWIRFAEEESVRIVVRGGAEAWMLAAALADAEIPVILDPFLYGPGDFDQVHARADNAAILDHAGVPVILSGFQTHNARVLRQLAGNAVRAGLAPDAALRAVTSTPAEVFGLERHGRIDDDAVANLVLWSGDPFELTTRVEAVWIGGRRVLLESRQTELLRKYRKLPSSR